MLPGDDVARDAGRQASQPGKDVTIVTYGSMLHASLEAAEKLEKQKGIDVEVIDIRTLQPLDLETIYESVSKTNRVVLVHEDTLTGGVGAEISALITERAFEMLDAPIKRVAALDTPTPFSPILEGEFLPNADKIQKAVLEVIAF